MSQAATFCSLYRSQRWSSTTRGKDGLWVLITGAAFPQRLSMEATLGLGWMFHVSHSCVRDKCILNVLLLWQNPKLNGGKARHKGNYHWRGTAVRFKDTNTNNFKMVLTYSKQAGLVPRPLLWSTAWWSFVWSRHSQTCTQGAGSEGELS